MLVALPYILIASVCAGSAADGDPSWLHLIVLRACWNALKFMSMDPRERCTAGLRTPARGRDPSLSAPRGLRRGRYSRPGSARLESADCGQGRGDARPTAATRPDHDAVGCERPLDSALTFTPTSTSVNPLRWRSVASRMREGSKLPRRIGTARRVRCTVTVRRFTLNRDTSSTSVARPDTPPPDHRPVRGAEGFEPFQVTAPSESATVGLDERRSCL